MTNQPAFLELDANQVATLDANLRKLTLSLRYVTPALSDSAQDASGRWSLTPKAGGLFVDLRKVVDALRGYRDDRINPTMGSAPHVAAAYDAAMANPYSLLEGTQAAALLEPRTGHYQLSAPLATPMAAAPAPSAKLADMGKAVNEFGTKYGGALAVAGAFLAAVVFLRRS